MNTSRPRMSRAESQQETRNRLIESAVELFAEHGVDATSLVAVAENAGFSRGAIHGNFTDKDELASAVIAFIIADLGPELTDALGTAVPTNDRLAAYITTHVDYCRRQPARAAAIIAAVGYLGRSTRTGRPDADRPGEHTQSYARRSADSVADIVALFQEGQARGEMREFDPIAMALSLRAVLDTAVPTHTGIDAGEIIALFDHATRSHDGGERNGGDHHGTPQEARS